MCKKKIILFWTFLVVAVAVITIVFVDNIAWKEININLSTDYNELFSQKQMKEKGHVLELPEYATDVSIAYLNHDGTKTLYVYSAPIRFLNSSGQYSIIDTRMANVKDTTMRDRGYIYTIANSDIKSFYPKEISETKGILVEKEISFEFGLSNSNNELAWYKKSNNFIGEEKNMLSYKNLINNKLDFNVYPSSLGTNCEILIKEKLLKEDLNFWFRVTGDNIQIKREPGGYITMNTYSQDENGNRTNVILAVIQKPLLKESNGDISDEVEFELLPQGDNLYKLKIKTNGRFLKKGTKMFLTLEMRREKQPDNAIYSKMPNLEYAYLRNYSVIGNSDKYGMGRLLVRYKFARFFSLRSTQIKEVNYYVYSLNETKDKFEMISVLEDWCSLTGNWSDNYKTGEKISVGEIKDHILRFDITNEVRRWCDDATGQMELNGMMLKSTTEKEGEWSVLLSNDNTLFNNVTQVNIE